MLGLGLLGRGIGVARFLAEAGANLTITDLKSAADLKDSLDQLVEYKNITYVLGEHRLTDFSDQDLIIKAAGVPLDSPFITEARKNNIPIKMDASLFLELAPPGIISIGVTGTRGKSTVTHWLEHILKVSNRPVYLGGNVRGIATLPLLQAVKAGDYIVLELDSWQLQGFGEAGLSPQVAVFTTFLRDHQNYYKGDMSAYLADKANIFLNQKAEDVLVLGEQAKTAVLEKYQGHLPGRLVVAGDTLPADWSVKLPGEHNRYNASLVYEAALALGLAPEDIKRGIETFPGVPGRLEYLGEHYGVKYYNDNNATTPDATMAAVKSFSEFKGKIILIGGGADKELDFTEYAQIVPDYVKKFILFKGAATEKIQVVLPPEAEVVVVDSMEAALKQAQACSVEGDLILLSPGAASFGVFKNEYERNDQFVTLVNSI